ncbi:hypothetical protein BVY04_05095, partial [bacterium M21]
MLQDHMVKMLRWFLLIIDLHRSRKDLLKFGKFGILGNQIKILLLQFLAQDLHLQKNSGYEMQHAYGLNDNAWKNYYLLLQISQLMNDLVRFSDYI